MCEVDADKWSSFLLAGVVRTQANELSAHSHIPFEVAVHDVLALTSSCLYRWYAHFNTNAVRPPTYYPNPLLRALRVAIGASDNIDRGQTSPQIALARASAALSGLAAGETVVGRLAGPPQREFDLGSELISFEAKYNSALAELDKKLLRFTKICSP
jgi:hypothetical protein